MDGKGNNSTGTRDSGGATSENSEEDQDEPSSSQNKDVFDELTNFRENWHKELSKPKNTSTLRTVNNTATGTENFEQDARKLFLKGIEMERAGKLYEAIQFYRRAVQIVPDIEFKIDNSTKPKIRDRTITEVEDLEAAEHLQESNSEDSDDDEIKDGELLSRIQRKISRASSLCSPKIELNATHIGQIPVEIMLYIIRWIVSSDLDMRSLEMFATVCRGFYLCARDPEIWHIACLRVWGLNCGSTPGLYGSWRQMFIEKPRVHFNGCYISKTTYIRNGENSFQDQFYRPWHLIAYYRYLRFFPEGSVLMLTTADEPLQCVGLMKNRLARYPVLSGYYRLKDDKLTLVVQQTEKKVTFQNYKKSRRRDVQEGADRTFHMELQIQNYHKKRHSQLVWTHYSVFTKNKRGDENTCNFDLRANRFPPLWFSRVKSFTAVAERPLI